MSKNSGETADTADEDTRMRNS